MSAMRRIYCGNPDDIQSLLSRDGGERLDVDAAVSAILADVKARGDEAVLEYTRRFDGCEPDSLRVSEGEIDRALDAVGEGFTEILREAGGNIRAYHERQKRAGFIITDRPGAVIGQRVMPLKRVGIYVPGGTASYPSTVLMNAIPAKIAGVPELVMVTPAGKDGAVAPEILAAARIAGVDRIFRIGGAQAVGALAYGTQSVPRVDKIVGPGNVYVATAKRMVFGLVDIDMIAGPSEVLIIADESANPEYVAMDMLSQAEHDRLAASFLVTASEALADAVDAKVAEFMPTLPRSDIARQAIAKNSAIVLTDSVEKAIGISNRIAPEHLELCVFEPFSKLPLIADAGSVFLGNYAPEALGDYFAGPNHTLPTGGTARFSSPLSVDDFIKKSSFIYYDKDALERVHGRIIAFAEREGLRAHANSVAVRFSGDGYDA